jgi:hypothetical protein
MKGCGIANAIDVIEHQQVRHSDEGNDDKIYIFDEYFNALQSTKFATNF